MNEPLILLPGLLCDAGLWAPQLPRLCSLVPTLVCPITTHDNVPDLAQMVLAQAPPRFALAALSMGGYVAMEIMRVAPERVTRLALLDTTARPDTPEQQQRRRLLLAMAKEGQFRGVTPRLLPLLIHPARLYDEPLTNVIMNMAKRVGRDAFIRQQTAILGRIDSRPSLSAVAVPSLIICGEQDALTPPDIAQEMAELIPNSELLLLPDCGHLATLEAPEIVTEKMCAWLIKAP